jgi:hypothetical protein
MRDKQEILEKFYELRDVKLKERKKLFLSQTPRNCLYNTRLRVKDNGNVGFCQNPIVLGALRARVFVCNEDDTACHCQAYHCKNTDEFIERDFAEILASPARCGHEYPKLAVLIWCLQDVRGAHGRAERFWSSVASVFKSVIRLIYFRWW